MSRSKNRLSAVFDYASDKTAPEAIIQFDPGTKDIKIIGTDNLSPGLAVLVQSSDNLIVLTDEADNRTEIDFNERDRKAQTVASIKSIKYNGVAVDVSRNTMKFSWRYNKKTELEMLSQYVKSQNGYSVTAKFDGVKTIITGTDASGKILQTLPGLKLLTVTTDKGDLSWSY